MTLAKYIMIHDIFKCFKKILEDYIFLQNGISIREVIIIHVVMNSYWANAFESGEVNASLMPKLTNTNKARACAERFLLQPRAQTLDMHRNRATCLQWVSKHGLTRKWQCLPTVRTCMGW